MQAITGMEGFKINIPKEYEWDIVEYEPLQQLIDDALEPHRQQFMMLVVNEHTRFWNKVHDRLDYARVRCAQYDERIDALCSLNVGDEVTSEIRNIEKIRRPLLTILRSPAADYDRLDAYLAHVQSKFDGDLHRNTAALGMRCINEGYDIAQLQVACVSVKTNGLVLDFDAGEKRGFEALFSYSNGSSVLRMPHMRCIVSERNLQRSKEAASSISPENHGQDLGDRLHRVLGNVSDEFCDMYMKAQAAYYHNIWDKLPYARQRYAELQQEIAAAGRLGKSAEAKRLRKVANSFGNLVNSEAAKHLTVDSYLNQIRLGWEDYFGRMTNVLAEKCIEKGMDNERTKVQDIQLNGKALDIRLTDGIREIMASCMLHGDKGVQYPPQLKTSEGKMVILEKQEELKGTKRLPSLQEEKVKLDNEAVPNWLITKAKIVEYADKLYITCHIAGERQAPQRIKPEEWKKYIAQSGNDKTGLVIAHFEDKIQQVLNAENQDLSRSAYRRNI